MNKREAQIIYGLLDAIDANIEMARDTWSGRGDHAQDEPVIPLQYINEEVEQVRTLLEQAGFVGLKL